MTRNVSENCLLRPLCGGRGSTGGGVTSGAASTCSSRGRKVVWWFYTCTDIQLEFQLAELAVS